MFRRIFLFFGVLIVLSGSISGQDENLRFQLERIILNDTEISLDETPGFLITIIDGKEVYHVPFGNRSLDRDTTISPADIFEIGSITKVLVAHLCIVLEERKQINLKDKVNDYLPLQFQNPRMEDLTLLDLLQHNAGFPFRPSFFGLHEKNPDDPYAYYSKQELLEYYAAFVPEKTGYNYSHTDYALLEVLLENALQKPFERLLEEYVFEPFRMNNAFVNFGEKTNGVITPGYDRASSLANPWQFKSFAAALGVKASTQDLVSFVQTLFDQTHSLFTTFEDNRKLQIATTYNDYLFSNIGWQVVKQKKAYDIFMHNGKTGGHNCFMALVNETKTAVIITSNSSIGTGDLGFLVLRMINNNWKRKT